MSGCGILFCALLESPARLFMGAVFRRGGPFSTAVQQAEAAGRLNRFRPSPHAPKCLARGWPSPLWLRMVEGDLPPIRRLRIEEARAFGHA